MNSTTKSNKTDINSSSIYLAIFIAVVTEENIFSFSTLELKFIESLIVIHLFKKRKYNNIPRIPEG